MNKFTYFIITICLACSFIAKGQVNLLDKMVQLPKGKMALKTALTLIEKQSASVFSYDPTKIEDKQILNITTSATQTVSATLKQILPIEIKYKQTGKYIVLQKNTKGQASFLEANLKPLSLNQQNKIVATALKIPHKTDMSTPADYLMPRKTETNVDTTTKAQDPFSIFQAKVDTFSTLAFKNYAYPSADLDSEKRNKQNKSRSNNVKADTLQNPLTTTNTLLKADTTIKVIPNPERSQPRNSLGNFLINRGVLELDFAANTRLATLSLRTGLYGVYAILAYTKVNNNNTRTGVGLGTSFKIWKNVGAGVELVGSRINNTTAKKIGVNSTMSQLSTELSYKLNNRYKFFIRPNISVLKSVYTRKAKEVVKVEDKEGEVETEDPVKVEDTEITLSRLTGIGGVIGMSIDINSLFYKNKTTN